MMKRFNFIPALIAIVLMITAVSCTTMTGTQDEYYERSQSPNRVYVDDPYRGTVVLERDPYSGRYYEVNSYGTNNRVYRNNNSNYGRNNRYSNDNRYRNDNRVNNPRVSTPRVSQGTQQPTEDQKREQQKNRDEARKKVLGN